MPDSAMSPRPPLRGEVMPDGPAPGLPPLEVLDWVSLLMDRLFPIPGTRFRWGFNALLLLVPVLGDVLAALVSAGILVIGLTHYRVPRIVAARMVLNSLLDAGLGWIPVFGDLFDLFFKADTRNVRLLREYAGWGGPPRPTWRHWTFVVGVLGLFVLVIGLAVWGVVALVLWLVR